jgi:ABC-type transport system involved in multi-copper enzyme maturation permease subunit
MTLTIARQMVGAEILKLRRNRTLMGFALLMSVGVVTLFIVYLQLRHASNPAQYEPAGGVAGFTRALRALGLLFGALTAILIGGEAGTADVSSGVFRDLVATGRSRLALFAARVPAAVLVTLVFTGAAFAVALAATYLFAGSTPTPSLGTVLEGAGWLVLANSTLATLAVAVGSLTGSRAVTLTGLIGWQTIATQILLNVTSLGSLRAALVTPALTHLSPEPAGIEISMSTVTAILVIVAWAVIPAAIGAWRTQTADA